MRGMVEMARRLGQRDDQLRRMAHCQLRQYLSVTEAALTRGDQIEINGYVVDENIHTWSGINIELSLR